MLNINENERDDSIDTAPWQNTFQANILSPEVVLRVVDLWTGKLEYRMAAALPETTSGQILATFYFVHFLPIILILIVLQIIIIPNHFCLYCAEVSGVGKGLSQDSPWFDFCLQMPFWSPQWSNPWSRSFYCNSNNFSQSNSCLSFRYSSSSASSSSLSLIYCKIIINNFIISVFLYYLFSSSYFSFFLLFSYFTTVLFLFYFLYFSLYYVVCMLLLSCFSIILFNASSSSILLTFFLVFYSLFYFAFMYLF